MAKITPDMIATILRDIGGGQNVAVCGNCMTRLRLTLRDKRVVDRDALKKVPGVMGVIDSAEQLQIILGPGRAQTAADLMNSMITKGESPQVSESRLTEVSKKEQEVTEDLAAIAAKNKQHMKSNQNSAIHHFLTKFATIFTPLIPGFIAAGLLLGIATLIEQAYVVNNPHASVHLIAILAYMKVFSKGLFTFLSILIGYNAQKAFGGSGVNGAIIASLFVLGYDPHATTGYYSGMHEFFGMVIDPRGNIIGVLIASIVGAWVEKQVRKIIPDTLDMILTSAITLLIMGAITFVIIMPVGYELFRAMSWLFLHLNSNPIGCAVLAGVFLIAVMFGIHQGFVPVYFSLVATQGFNSLFPILSMAGGGQVGASLALYLRAKSGSALRSQISGAIIPGLLGIGEPLIYGVTLPRVKPFITACLGGACGGFFIGLVAFFGLPVGLNTVFGPSGLVAIPLMTSLKGVYLGIIVYIVGLLISYLMGFVLTWFFGSKNVDLS